MSDGSKDNIAERISLRPAVLPDDEEFLRALYYTTREDDVAMWGMTDEQAKPLLDMQYNAQMMQYKAQYPEMRYDVIVFEGKDVGRLMTDREDETMLNGLELSIMPEYRSKGIGEIVMRRLMDEADAGNKPFLFSVVKTNFKAIKFYRRLGIAFTGETMSHYLLEWREAKQAENI
jgi:ribosomal protein S18 acetylase RimI-like enzyme